MSLTSYRAAPPRGGECLWCGLCEGVLCSGLGRPGGDLLSRVLRRSTIGAEGFHGRVRNGIGCIAPRHNHQVIEASKGCEEEVHFIGLSHHLLIAACDERIKPMEQLVPVSCTHYCASTPGLST